MNRIQNQVVKEIKKRDKVIIRICRGIMGGYNYVEIRQYIADKSGDYVPTKKGLTFNPKHLDEFIEGFKELKNIFNDYV